MLSIPGDTFRKINQPLNSDGNSPRPNGHKSSSKPLPTMEVQLWISDFSFIKQQTENEEVGANNSTEKISYTNGKSHCKDTKEKKSKIVSHKVDG